MDTLLHTISPFGLAEFGFIWRLLVAAVLGTLMGLERSIAGKHAGMRTYALVAMGSCLFCLISVLAGFELTSFAATNPLLIASSVVVGIGFIGSGLALTHGEKLGELTTASGVWVVAGVGMACGFGLFITAAVATILTIIIFSFFSRVERYLRITWGVDGQ